MARPIRIEFAGALYHVTSRGDRRENIYLDEQDREIFLTVLRDVCQRSNWLVHAYCLMDNHYHLLIETPDGNLSSGMRQLNGVYTQRFNRKSNRVGHVFQGRFKSILVQKQSYLLELSRYIVLNPVRAKMVKYAKDWAWSSYREMVGFVPRSSWLSVDWILSSFSKEREEAIRLYEIFVANGVSQPKPWGSLSNQVYLGDDDFVEEMQNKFKPKGDLNEIPLCQRRKVAQPLVYYRDRYQDRDLAVTNAYESGAYTMKVIGEFFDLHYSRVSRIISAKGKT